MGSGDGSLPTCTTFGPWSAPTPLSALNTGSDDWEPALHPDGELLVFNRAFVGNFVATRNGAQFETPEPLQGWSPGDFGPAWLPTGDRMYLTHAISGGTYRIWESTYAGGVFGAPTELAGMTGTFALSPTIRYDGLELYYTTEIVNPAIARATRPDPSSPWTVTGVETQLALPSGHAGWPSISRDGLTLYFEGIDAAGLHLYAATRSTVAERFGAPALITELDGIGDAGDPEISSDGLTLFYAIGSDTGSQFDLVYSTRSCL